MGLQMGWSVINAFRAAQWQQIQMFSCSDGKLNNDDKKFLKNKY